MNEDAGDDPVADLQELKLMCQDHEAPLPIKVLTEKLQGAANGPAILRAHGNGETLLHVVCRNEHVTLDFVKFLVEMYPEAVKHQSMVGTTLTEYPLHHACSNHVIPREIVEYLIDLFPEALMTSANENTPLARIISNQLATYTPRPLRLDLVRCIIAKSPECVRVRVGSQGATTVIHLACSLSDPSIELVQILVQQWPDALSVISDEEQWLPLHELLLSSEGTTPLDLVQFLIDFYPEAVRTPVVPLGSFPLHLACSHRGQSKEVIQLLAETYPEALTIPGNSGNYALHDLVFGNSTKLEVVQYLVEKCPDALQRPNREGALPLRCAMGQSLEIVQYLVEKYPDAAQDNACFLQAARCGKLEVIQYAHRLNPQAAMTRNRDGDTCLHMACKQQCNLEIYEFLLSLYPQSISITNRNGDLPLHIACQQGMPEAVVRFLLVRNPGAIKVKNNSHCLPLHLASHNALQRTAREVDASSSCSVFSMLIDAYPQAIREFDMDGRLPLHHACHRGCSVEDIKLLVQQYPPSIRVVSPAFGLPIHVAAAHQYRLPLLQYLEEMAPESLDTYVRGIGLPLHASLQQHASTEYFEYLLRARYQDHTVPFLHAILGDRHLLDKGQVADHYLDAFPWAATKLDSMGRSPLHLAVATNLEMSFIQRLIEHDMNAVELRDKSNSIPLHYALRHGDPANVVGLLLDRYTEGVKVADANGFLPLHVACRHGAPLDVVTRLVDMYGESVAAMDAKGELALHKACRGGHFALVEFLAEKNAASVRAPTSNGTLPVFLLCQSSGKKNGPLLDENAALETIWFLLRKHPESILTTSREAGGNESFAGMAGNRRKRIRLE